MNAIEKIPCAPSLGTDVEGFLVHKKTGKTMPCVGLVPGTKEKPHQLRDYPKGFCIQEDNVMVEFNVPPATTYRTFAKQIHTIVDAINNTVPKGFFVEYTADHKFLAKELLSPQAKTIGCEPDYSAYNGGHMRTPPTSTGLWRGAGGHIHLGGDFQCPDFVAALFCDVVLGIGQSMTDGHKNMRHNFYGQPGIFRPKPYGIEWRSPSSEWVNKTSKFQYMADSGIRLARWMTDTDARDLQAVFRKIDWVRIRKYLQFQSNSDETLRAVERQQILEAVSRAGLPT